MLTQKEILEFRNYLKKAENPLFFFDDDHDGLASFLLLWRSVKKGHGVLIKGPPFVDMSYIKKIHEYKADKLFILDKPVLSQEFVDQVNIPIIYIDHHKVNKLKGVHYYNPQFNDVKDNRPAAYWCYKVVKQDIWIATVGSVGDYHVPDFIEQFKKEHPTLVPEKLTINELLYNSKLGKLIKIFNFILKCNTSDTMKCIKILTRIETPEEILNQETPRGRFLYRIFEKINKKYEAVYNDAIKTKPEGKLLLYTYAAKDSFTSVVSNEISYKHPDKIVIIARRKDDRVIMSLRSTKIVLPPLIRKALDGIEGYGGGHDLASAANVPEQDFTRFIDQLKAQII